VEKTIALISRRADLSREAFREYYETRHAFLGMKHFQFRKYLRNHVAPGEDAPGFDVFSEFWNVSVAKAYETMAGPIGEVMRADERNFMNQSKQRAARATEILLAGPTRVVDPVPTAKEILLLTRDPSADKAAFLTALAKKGEEIVKRDECDDCHSADGKSEGVDGAPNFAGRGTIAWIERLIRDGSAGTLFSDHNEMPKFGRDKLSDEDVAALAQLIARQRS